MANDKKQEGGKPPPPPKVETINLKVLIHCEGCKKKVRKTLICIEGVHTVDIDDSLGKVTVTGTVDSKTLIKKLEKAGKVAEVLPSGGGGAGKGKGQQKGENNKNQKEEGKEKKGKNEDDEDDNDDDDAGDNKAKMDGGGGGKKKKGGGGDGVNELALSKNMVNRNVAPYGIQTGYISMGSAEYATNMFSDENANSCHIM